MQIDDEENFELPGPWIDHPDREWAFFVQMFLGEVLDQLNDARLLLTLFEERNRGAPQFTGRDQRLRFIYAKSFVYALDAVYQLIGEFHKQKKIPVPARDYCRKFRIQFDELHELRNSLQHIEARLQGLDRNNQPIPSSLLVLGAFRDNHFFGATTSNGCYVEIEISYSVWIQAYTIIEDLIWCFDWLGPADIRLVRPPARK